MTTERSYISGSALRASRGPFRFLQFSVAWTTAEQSNIVGLVVDIETARELMCSTREDCRRMEMRDAMAVVITDEWESGRTVERLAVWSRKNGGLS